MKKVKILGKAIPIFVLVLLGIGMVSGALVGYLSMTMTADITVESPMVTGISEGKDTWAEASYPDGEHTLGDWTTSDTPLLISGIHGGETVTLYTMSANVADVLITGFEEAIVSNPLGVTCDDFESIWVRVDSIYGDLGYGTPQELITLGACFKFGSGVDAYVMLGSPGDSTWDVGETDVTEIKVTFKTNAKGIYTFTYRVIPATGN